MLSAYSPPEILGTEDQLLALKLARAVLEAQVTNGQVDPVEDLGVELTEGLREPLPVFVTIKVRGDLRGCIGTMVSTGSLAECIHQRTIQASSNDTRFLPIEKSELGESHIEISVLTLPSPVASADDIVIGQHGIVLNCSGYRSVLLPSVAPSRGWNLEQTLDVLAAKAGVTAPDWKERAQYEVFEAQSFQEDEN